MRMNESPIESPLAVPSALRRRDQWVCLTENAPPTISSSAAYPLTPATLDAASLGAESEWASFGAALAVTQSHPSLWGIGYILSVDDPFVGIALTDCRDPMAVKTEPWTESVIAELNSYTEMNPAGTGYHIFVRGSVPRGSTTPAQIEVYERNKFLPITGSHVETTPIEIKERPRELKALTTVHTGYSHEGMLGEH